MADGELKRDETFVIGKQHPSQQEDSDADDDFDWLCGPVWSTLWSGEIADSAQSQQSKAALVTDAKKVEKPKSDEANVHKDHKEPSHVRGLLQGTVAAIEQAARVPIDIHEKDPEVLAANNISSSLTEAKPPNPTEEDEHDTTKLPPNAKAKQRKSVDEQGLIPVKKVSVHDASIGVQTLSHFWPRFELMSVTSTSSSNSNLSAPSLLGSPSSSNYSSSTEEAWTGRRFPDPPPRLISQRRKHGSQRHYATSNWLSGNDSSPSSEETFPLKQWAKNQQQTINHFTPTGTGEKPSRGNFNKNRKDRATQTEEASPSLRKLAHMNDSHHGSGYEPNQLKKARRYSCDSFSTHSSSTPSSRSLFRLHPAKTAILQTSPTSTRQEPQSRVKGGALAFDGRHWRIPLAHAAVNPKKGSQRVKSSAIATPWHIPRGGTDAQRRHTDYKPSYSSSTLQGEKRRSFTKQAISTLIGANRNRGPAHTQVRLLSPVDEEAEARAEWWRMGEVARRKSLLVGERRVSHRPTFN